MLVQLRASLCTSDSKWRLFIWIKSLASND